ncbi:DUF3408 domain-containing protein [Dysgonomonas sp. 521]|uniref:DUF3408 domain-containing protein n=1 Tax=Dysgonomonas sp. 521 TaxID=2302932 RepID=UPI0013D5BE8B|nr:DUF3408 domain-containing protein [Dysgonomonas sp. 521]NDV97558.1 DUF3408 domain-containing protein [Dysgonomonas sp. 521]
MGEQENDKDRNMTKNRKVEIPNQEALLSSLSQVHKAGDLSKEVIPEEQVQEPAVAENRPAGIQQRRKRSVQTDESPYKNTFLKRYETDNRKNVYISGELHKTVSDIVAAVKIIDGKNIPVGSYIDNVLAEHFETHQEEINSLYRIGKNDLVK